MRDIHGKFIFLVKRQEVTNHRCWSLVLDSGVIVLGIFFPSLSSAFMMLSMGKLIWFDLFLALVFFYFHHIESNAFCCLHVFCLKKFIYLLRNDITSLYRIRV